MKGVAPAEASACQAAQEQLRAQALKLHHWGPTSQSQVPYSDKVGSLSHLGLPWPPESEDSKSLSDWS